MENNNEKPSLRTACIKRGSGLYALAKKSGISVSQLYTLESKPSSNIGVKTIEKIYKASGIRPSEYLNLDFEW